jgi:hypothetical protein
VCGPNPGKSTRFEAGGHRAVVQQVAPRHQVLDRALDDRGGILRQCVPWNHVQRIHVTTLPDGTVSYCRRRGNRGDGGVQR